LQYFDVNLNLVHESPTLNLLTGPDINPAYMIEKSRMLYLNVPGTGILVFDRFGNYSKTIALDIPLNFQVTDNFLYYLKDGKIISYNLHTAEMAELKIPMPGLQEAENPDGRTGIIGSELQPGLLFIFTGKGYLVYRTE
jgi:hypothetical protein